jgi:hypothetical protein
MEFAGAFSLSSRQKRYDFEQYENQGNKARLSTIRNHASGQPPMASAIFLKYGGYGAWQLIRQLQTPQCKCTKTSITEWAQNRAPLHSTTCARTTTPTSGASGRFVCLRCWLQLLGPSPTSKSKRDPQIDLMKMASKLEGFPLPRPSNNATRYLRCQTTRYRPPRCAVHAPCVFKFVV